MDKEITYTDEQQRWRLWQVEEDTQREQCYGQVNQFPNLFAIRRSFQVRHRNQRLLERQRQEAEAGWFQYQLERDRCQNLIVFLLFLLDRKEEAVVLCEKLLAGNETSIITLTSLAVLQWETGRREDSYKTIRVLQALRDAPNFQYLQAVAVAEKGYVFISHGPKYFLKAIDMFEEAIAKSPDGSDVYLWKYDLALAIRRNFNVFAYAEHSRLSAPWLARRAVELLNDTSTHCPNGLYRARSLVELASLVSAINSFKRVCREADRREIAQLRLDDHMSILRQALDTPEGQEDSYVLRVAGRFYGLAKQFDTAIDCLLKSRQKRDEGIVNQLLAKTTLSHYKWKRHRGGARSQDRGRQSFGRSPGRGRSGWGRSGRGYRGGRGGGAYQAQSSFQPQERQQSGGGWRREEPRGFTSSRDNPLRKLLKSAADIYDHYDPEDPDVKQAEFFYLRALECDPYNHGAVYDTGLLYQGMDKPEMALGYFQQTVASSDPLIGSLQLVNNYEQAGLCLLEMSEQAERGPDEKRQLVARAEEMLKGCVRECRQAVVHLPKIGAKRTHLWESYSRLRWNLNRGSGDSGTYQLEKKAGVHQLLSEYLEGLQVYQDVFRLGRTVHDRKDDLLKLLGNYISLNRENEAKFVFDLFLSSDKQHVILDGTDDVSVRLRQAAVDVYVRSARHALRSKLMRDARLCFQAALLIRGLIKGDKPGALDDDDVSDQGPAAEEEQEQDAVEICIFDDRADAAAASRDEAEKVSGASAALANVTRDVFGMSVSLNDEAAPPGLLTFEGELQLAGMAGLVVLVLPPGDQLSPRMTYLTNTALQSHDANRVLPVVMATPGQPAPRPLHEVPPFPEAMDLLPLAEDGADLASHSDTIVKLFTYILNTATQ